MLESDVAGCRVGFKDGSHAVEAPACDAICVENDAIYVPEPAPVINWLVGLLGVAGLARSRRSRRGKLWSGHDD